MSSKYDFGRDFARNYTRRANDSAEWAVKGGLLGAGVLGGLGALGAGVSRTPPAFRKEDKEKSPARRKAGQVLGMGLAGALSGAHMGGTTGARYGETMHGPDAAIGKTLHDRYLNRLKEHGPAAFEGHLNNLGLSGNERSKSDVVKKFRSALAKAHPDRGGTSADFIKARNSEAALKASKWFKKLAASTLPVLSTIRKSTKRTYDWKPSLSDKVKEYFRHEPEFGNLPKQLAGVGAASGAVTSVLGGAYRNRQIDQAIKEKALTKEEATHLKRRHGVLGSVLKGSALGAASALAPFYALHRKRPAAGANMGFVTGALSPLLLARATGPHGPFRNKAEDKYTKFDDKKDTTMAKKWEKRHK